MESKDIRIRPKCQEAFIMRGSYHILANQLKISWHVIFLSVLNNYLIRRCITVNSWNERACDSFVTEKVTLKSKI